MSLSICRFKNIISKLRLQRFALTFVPNRRRIIVGSEGYTFAIATITEMSMTNVEKLLMKRMKKTDSKVNYKNFHLNPVKEVEKSKHLGGDLYVNSVLENMSDDDLYCSFID